MTQDVIRHLGIPLSSPLGRKNPTLPPFSPLPIPKFVSPLSSLNNEEMFQQKNCFFFEETETLKKKIKIQ